MLSADSDSYIFFEHSLPFLRNLIGQFQGAKSLSSPQALNLVALYLVALYLFGPVAKF